jgi:hypothetical protein
MDCTEEPELPLRGKSKSSLYLFEWVHHSRTITTPITEKCLVGVLLWAGLMGWVGGWILSHKYFLQGFKRKTKILSKAARTLNFSLADPFFAIGCPGSTARTQKLKIPESMQ